MQSPCYPSEKPSMSFKDDLIRDPVSPRVAMESDGNGAEMIGIGLTEHGEQGLSKAGESRQGGFCDWPKA